MQQSRRSGRFCGYSIYVALRVRLGFDWVLPHGIIIHQGMAIRKVGVVTRLGVAAKPQRPGTGTW